MEGVRQIYTPSFPVGPAIADSDTVDKKRLALLFDPDNKLVSQLNHELSLIIGRKGSGKTTLLASVQLSEPSAQFFYLPSSDLFAQVVREINSLSDGVVYVEQVSRLWDFVLWGIVFKVVADKYRDKDIMAFCQELGVVDQGTPYEIISAMLAAIKSFPPVDWPLPEKILYKKIGKISFLQAKQIAADRLSKANARIFLLLDSLEDFKLSLPSYGTAVAGLLRCLGEFNEHRSNSVVLRCCLPAERYFDYNNISTNPLKDFRSGMLLHWSAGELLHLCAIRYSRYIKEYYPEAYKTKFRKLDFKKREHLEQFWDLVFPNPVISRLGTAEKPIAYILRHSQLLPRHFIVLLNEIISRSIKQSSLGYNIDSEHIRAGVFHSETKIFDQIVEAYTTPVRDPRAAAMHVLKELRTVFTWSDFDKVANKVVRLGIPGASDRTELMALLVEIGAIGRVVGESERYFEGVFEYMVPHRLIFSERDKFCIHPVFTEVCNANVSYQGVKGIYTYWSGITDTDLEDWM